VHLDFFSLAVETVDFDASNDLVYLSNNSLEKVTKVFTRLLGKREDKGESEEQEEQGGRWRCNLMPFQCVCKASDVG